MPHPGPFYLHAVRQRVFEQHWNLQVFLAKGSRSRPQALCCEGAIHCGAAARFGSPVWCDSRIVIALEGMLWDVSRGLGVAQS